MTVPFNRQTAVGNEIDYARAAVESGYVMGDGRFSTKCQALLERELGIGKCLLTTSCTHALEMSALLLDVGPGDEFVLPSFTFVSTANAYVLRGARPVFVDIRPDTLNLDEAQLAPAISDRTRAVLPVHYGGVGCEMDAILDVAGRHGVAVVEDNAHGLFGRYKERPLGAFGAMATQSFHESKNFSCGEGGALLINDERLVERAEIIRDKGTNRGQLFRGMVDKYTWLDVGSSYVLSDILAAVLLAQLEARDRIQAERRQTWELYADSLRSWAVEQGVQLPVVPPHCEPAYHLFHMVMPTPEARAAIIEHLKRLDVNAVFHYLPLHLSRMGQRLGGRPGTLPVTERISDCLVRLPLYAGMTAAEREQVVDAVAQFDVSRAAVSAG